MDDGFKKKNWYDLKTRYSDFEGWCVGAKSEKNYALKKYLIHGRAKIKNRYGENMLISN